MNILLTAFKPKSTSKGMPMHRQNPQLCWEPHCMSHSLQHAMNLVQENVPHAGSSLSPWRNLPSPSTKELSLLSGMTLTFLWNVLYRAQGEKKNFLSVLWTWNLTFHWPFSTNPVEDRTKCMPNVGRVWHLALPFKDWWKIVNEMWDFMYTGQMGNFIFRPMMPKRQFFPPYDIMRLHGKSDCWSQPWCPCEPNLQPITRESLMSLSGASTIKEDVKWDQLTCNIIMHLDEMQPVIFTCACTLQSA